MGQSKDTGKFESSYTEEKGDRICELIAEGNSLVKILKEDDILAKVID